MKIKILYRLSIIVLLWLFCITTIKAQQPAYSKLLTATVMDTWKKDSFATEGKPASRWTYDQGVILEGVAAVWKQTGDKTCFDYIQKSMDFYVKDDGTINTYKQDDYNIDNIKNGRSLLMLYRVTGKEKYWKAATTLREQLRHQPRTNEGGFWHKKIYPYQMWLDGLYMAEPFYTEYAMIAHEDSAFDDIANQFIWMENHARDAKTGLLYHGWDESGQMAWADKKTGLSPNFWARAMGWYAVALVDVLENFPADHPKRKALVNILNRLVIAIEKVQDKKTGLWYDVLDKPAAKGNYFEASASSMFVLSVAKGVRLGLIPKSKLSIATKGYAGIVARFIKTENGQVNLHGTVKVSGLGGKPFRDGSLEYYFKEPVIVNDPKGLGAAIMAATEIEMLSTLKQGEGRKLAIDGFFNHETAKDITGKTIQTHYVLNQMDNGGYSLFGNIFNRYGVQTSMLTVAPTAENLKKTAVYFIIDPDWPKENPSPEYILPQHIEVIYNWVKAGGVLMMFSNDSGNVEFTHYNQLAEKFGIHFNENKPRNLVKGNDYPTGTIDIPAGNEIFKTAKNIYIKEISTLSLKAPARAVLTDKGDNIVAVAKVGKGTVFAIGDPWVYNEYLDGRKLPDTLENFKAAEDLVAWLVKQTKK
ncbi:glycoside hydrolase family 88 protein [Ferruginibacter sp. HRS2-29]|uniref:glycoside hydrolase family 88 protein n=1 Tax=Ferruginibacter sp. HRS2-29 TaxID=2487334 RepID=UPI0020CCF13F|nr:glycoside hydrolase family 88 protein [Ferruginibacter sp. HRS2-29]MCP9752009.1 glycoside hydrolase family 88 protein [Ferruginibacter sp. HRS2-29]